MRDCCETEIITANSCTRTLSKVVRENFVKGDIIGLTFISDGVASIFTGIFIEIIDEVVIVKDLLVVDTTSFIPLCDVSSVETGIIINSNETLSVKSSKKL